MLRLAIFFFVLHFFVFFEPYNVVIKGLVTDFANPKDYKCTQKAINFGENLLHFWPLGNHNSLTKPLITTFYGSKDVENQGTGIALAQTPFIF